MAESGEWLPEPPPMVEVDRLDRLAYWIGDHGYDYLISTLVHAILMAVLMIAGSLLTPKTWHVAQDSLTFDAPDSAPQENWQPERYEVGKAPWETTELTTESLTQFKYVPTAQTAAFYDHASVFQDSGGGKPADRNLPALGGLGGFNVKNLVGAGGLGGVGIGIGEGQEPGSGGQDSGFGARGAGYREAMVGAFGGTKATERAVAAALNWLHRHQEPAGNWSLRHTRRCVAPACSGSGTFQSDAAATAMALLPFLAAGQTHKSSGPYQKTIAKGVAWLVKHQRADGDLSVGASQPMYSHGLATIVLCEAYGLTRDSAIGYAARKAVRYIEMARCPHTAGWRYRPGDAGDLSVTGWQVMALKSAHMAGLGDESAALDATRPFLKSCGKGNYGGLFCYMPQREETVSMTAVGILCMQYLGSGRNDPGLAEGKKYLMDNLPDVENARDIYYWYYATQVMHNYLGPEWDTWNRRMRRILIQTQEKYGCATGSWSPTHPSPDPWGKQGGRLYMTSLSALTLEIYYRYLPLFRIQGPGAPQDPMPRQDVVRGMDGAEAPMEKGKGATTERRG